eukprot:355965-Chlamydomonas_euryale.AAC.6
MPPAALQRPAHPGAVWRSLRWAGQRPAPAWRGRGSDQRFQPLSPNTIPSLPPTSSYQRVLSNTCA